MNSLECLTTGRTNAQVDGMVLLQKMTKKPATVVTVKVSTSLSK